MWENLFCSKSIRFLICLSLVLSALVTTAAGNYAACSLQLKNKLCNWQDEFSMLVVQKSGTSNYELQTTKTMAQNDKVFMHCQRKPQVEVQCDARTSRVNIPFPLPPQCSYQQSLPVQMIKAQDRRINECKYDLYKIGYQINVGGRTQFLETYQICFDSRRLRPIYTINKAYEGGYAGKRPEVLIFNPDNIFKPSQFGAFNRPRTYETFLNLLGQNQPYMRRDEFNHIIDRGHLTANGDFNFPYLQKSTFLMENVIPQFKTINMGNWAVIEEWSRTDLAPSEHSLICNGVLDCEIGRDNSCVLQLRNVNTRRMVPMFLYRDQIPIPLWIFKIVKRYAPYNDHTVFLTYNNIYEENPSSVRPPSKLCKIKDCPVFLESNKAEGLTFCCEYNEFILNAVPYLNGACGDKVLSPYESPRTSGFILFNY